MSKLIVIRGPSGSGKSTVAKELQKFCPRRTLLHEDQIRFMFSSCKEPAPTASKKLASAAILSGLESGFDVIYEGISNIKTYKKYFDQIFKEHPHDNYFFYLDVTFEETVKIHETRPEKADFGIDEMNEWRDYASPTGFDFETIIPDDFTVKQTVDRILEVAKLVNE